MRRRPAKRRRITPRKDRSREPAAQPKHDFPAGRGRALRHLTGPRGRRSLSTLLQTPNLSVFSLFRKSTNDVHPASEAFLVLGFPDIACRLYLASVRPLRLPKTMNSLPLPQMPDLVPAPAQGAFRCGNQQLQKRKRTWSDRCACVPKFASDASQGDAADAPWATLPGRLRGSYHDDSW